MIHEHNEIEAKMNAEGVSIDKFKEYMFAQYNVVEFKSVTGPDYYYENGDSVVRHRVETDKKHELTVKKRKSDASTRDRLEIDLLFSGKTAPEDVQAFLLASGYKRAMTLVKHASIFWVQLTPRLLASFVIYDVQDIDKPGTRKRFIEIEAEKGSSVSVTTAKRHVNSCVAELKEVFNLAEPLNESLWEIYSGKRYGIQGESE